MELGRQEVSRSFRVDGPFRLIGEDALFSSVEAKSSGLYIFSVEMNDRYLIEYAGMTSRCFAERMTEHIREYLSGGYKIYDLEKFLTGKRVPLWNGRFGNPREKDISVFLERYDELGPTILSQLRAYRIFLVPIADKRIAERLEGAMYEILKNSGVDEAREFIDGEVRYRRRRAEEEAIKIRLASDVSFLGLLSEFEI